MNFDSKIFRASLDSGSMIHGKLPRGFRGVWLEASSGSGAKVDKMMMMMMMRGFTGERFKSSSDSGCHPGTRPVTAAPASCLYNQETQSKS